MRVLFEFTHPIDVHLFKHLVWALQARGHGTAIAARDKDVILDLLRGYGLSFTCLSRRGRGLFGLAQELVVRDWRLWRFARRFRPDLLVSSVGPCAAHVGWLMRRPVLVVDNTEHGRLQHRIAFPFATRICTADYYQKDLGAKQVRYRSFEHLAYLHPNRFAPDPSVVERAGVRPHEPFLMVRFVSWEATHDVGEHGIRPDERMRVLERLERFGRVIVTSERSLPPEFDRFRLPVAPHEYHHLLAFARLCLSEGGTVAAEAAVLGVPTVFVSTLRPGCQQRLEEYYQLLIQVEDAEAAIAQAERLLSDDRTPVLWSNRQQRLLDEEGDLTEWLLGQVRGLCATVGSRDCEQARGH